MPPSTIFSGGPTLNRVYQETVKEAHDKLAMGAYFVCPRYTLVSSRECVVFFDSPWIPDSMRLHQDIHAGASETAKIAAFFPEDVDAEIARTLPPSGSFGPRGYWGDPASFEKIAPSEIRQWADRVAVSSAEAIAAFMKERERDSKSRDAARGP